jgi:aldehyde dehydrogenase (NAD+)
MKSLDKLFNKYGLNKLSHGCSTGSEWFSSGDTIQSYSPVDGKLIGEISSGSKKDFDNIIQVSKKAFKEFREIPAPKRGELVRQFGNKLREEKELLGTLVSYEMGKSYQEGLGEVQEMIDICDFAVGLSRQLHGLTMHSERPTHRMYEQYHPLGIVGIISAFNFPVAVWSWNVALAWVCGNVAVWKPSEKTPLCSIICQKIIGEVLRENDIPEGVSCLINGDYKIGEMLSQSKNIPLLSATGSTRMGKIVSEKVGARLGKTLLELGGNNAIIVTPDADLKMTMMGTVFGAVGTCGQRCTSTRRLIVHEKVYDKVKQSLVKAYNQIKIGDPLDSNNHVGPLIDKLAVESYKSAISKVNDQGGTWLVEGEVLSGKKYSSGCYVKPAIAEVNHSLEIVHQETFAPILYLIKYSGKIQNAIEIKMKLIRGFLQQ